MEEEFEIVINGTLPDDMDIEAVIDAIIDSLCKETRGLGECDCSFVVAARIVDPENSCECGECTCGK